MSVVNEDDLFRILISSDIHLGYGEKLPERGNDSFNSFDELLQIGKDREVDMVLLGGDLFHENKPSRDAMLKCVSLLTKHVLGNRPVQIEYLSDPAKDFQHCLTQSVNYEDPNMNVALPIFSIHGNHDDPCGLGSHSCMDLLHESRLVNYFGKVSNLSEVRVRPVLLKKGNVRVALYGLSHIRDERLHRLFRDKKVIFEMPADEEEEDGAMTVWCNILVLHQNRAKRGPTNYIPESFIPDFFHLVIWGHEHDCRIVPEPSERDFYICQPGSPVATSLCEGEAIPKMVAVLTIRPDTKFKVEAIPLTTVRPLIFKTISMGDLRRVNFKEKSAKKVAQQIETELRYEVEEMIREADALLTGHPNQGKKPLLRLRVEYTEEAHQLNSATFGNQFIDKVCNAHDILLFKRRIERVVKDEKLDGLSMGDMHIDTGATMEDLLVEYFANQEDENKKMKILSVLGLSQAVKSYVDKNDTDAISYIVEKQLEKANKLLLERTADVDNVDEEMERIQGERSEEAEAAEAAQLLEHEDRPQRRLRPDPEDVDNEASSGEDMDLDNKKRTSGGKARSGVGGARGGGGAARGHGAPKKTAAMFISDDDSEDDDDELSSLSLAPPKTRGGRGGSRAAASRVAVTTAATSARKTATTAARSTDGWRGRGATMTKRGRAGHQTTITAAFAASQSQNTRTVASSQWTQKSRKQVFDSDSE